MMIRLIRGFALVLVAMVAATAVGGTGTPTVVFNGVVLNTSDTGWLAKVLN